MEVEKNAALGESYAFVCTGNEKLWIPSKSTEIRFEQGDLLRILATNIRGKDRKDYRTGDVMYVLILLLWEQLWDCNLVSTECS